MQPPTEVTCGPNGPFVYLFHGAGFTTRYSHLDPASITVRRKQRLNNQDPGDNRVLDNILLEGRSLRDYRVAE